MIERLKKLYDFIVERSLNNEKTTVKDVCDAFPNEYKLNAKESNYTNSPKIYEDIDGINEQSDYTDYIIIKDNNNFKVGDRAEVEEYMDKLQKHALKQLKKYWNIRRKYAYKNNYIVNDKANISDFVDTFVDTLEPIHYSDDFLKSCSIKQLHEYTKSIGGYVLNGWSIKDYIDEIRRVENERKKHI
jgi:hypothetical protein